MEEDKPPNVQPVSHEWVKETRDGVPNYDHVRLACECVGDNIRAVGGPGCEVVCEEVNRQRRVAAGLQRWNDSVPAPSSKSSAVDESERAHVTSSFLGSDI